MEIILSFDASPDLRIMQKSLTWYKTACFFVSKINCNSEKNVLKYIKETYSVAIGRWLKKALKKV